MWKKGISENGIKRLKKAQDYSGNRLESYVDIMESAAFAAYQEAVGEVDMYEISVEDLAPFRAALRKLVRKLDSLSENAPAQAE